MTTPRLALELRDDVGLREEGRSLWPEKSAERLPAAEKGERKLEEREARRAEEEEDNDLV